MNRSKTNLRTIFVFSFVLLLHLRLCSVYFLCLYLWWRCLLWSLGVFSFAHLLFRSGACISFARVNQANVFGPTGDIQEQCKCKGRNGLFTCSLYLLKTCTVQIQCNFSASLGEKHLSDFFTNLLKEKWVYHDIQYWSPHSVPPNFNVSSQIFCITGRIWIQ